jgi:hypothetical protein
MATTGYSEEDSNSSSDPSSPAAIRAVERLKQLAINFDQLRDAVLPLGVDVATQTWTMEKVLEDLRISDEDSPASIIKYDLSDEQKATFLNGILDLCAYVCNVSISSSSNLSNVDAEVDIFNQPDQNISRETETSPDSDTAAAELVQTGDDDVVITVGSSSAGSEVLASDEDFMEGIERIRVGSKLRDLHGLFELQLLFEPTRDVQKKMTEMMSQRADDVSSDKDELLAIQKQFRRTKEIAMKELEHATAQVEEQEEQSNAFGPRMATVFEKRNGIHDEQISLLELSGAAADFMLDQQQHMLDGRQCFCLVVDRRQVRRNCYCCICTLIVICIVYAMSSIPGI